MKCQKHQIIAKYYKNNISLQVYTLCFTPGFIRQSLFSSRLHYVSYNKHSLNITNTQTLQIFAHTTHNTEMYIQISSCIKLCAHNHPLRPSTLNVRSHTTPLLYSLSLLIIHRRLQTIEIDKDRSMMKTS